MSVAREVVRGANGYDVDAASLAAGLLCEDESLALQSQAEEADINVLVRRFGVTGLLPVREMPQALVGHVEEFDLMTAQALLIEARDSFLSLEADVRTRFANDPLRFVQFAQDPANVDEMVRLGLAVKKPVAAPVAPQKVEFDAESAARLRAAFKHDPDR